MTNTPQGRREPEPATEVLITPDALQDRLMEAYKAGCYAVHEHYQPDPDPDFTEAAWDYVAGLDFTEDTRPHRALSAPPLAEEAVKKALGLAMAALQTIQGMEPITHEITLPTVMAQHAVDALNEIKALGATSCPNPCGECRGVVRVGKCDSCGWETHYEMAAHSHQPDLSRRVDRAAPDRGVAEGDRAVKDLLATIADFLEDEADNRAAAGSEMSDYEREPRELAERVRQAISAPPAPVAGGWRPGPFADVHELKTWPEFYEAVEDERKPWELREYDRPYKVGDLLHLREWRPHTERYTGRECWRGVTYLFIGDGGWLPEGKCIMGLVPYAPPSTDPVPVGGDEHPTPDAAGELAEALAAADEAVTVMARAFTVMARAFTVMARAFERIHSMPRTSDTELAERVSKAKERLRQAAARLRSQGSE